jgi:glucokinase
MPDDHRFLGIEIGGTKLQVIIGTGDGEIIRSWRGTVRRELGGKGIREQLSAAIKTLLAGEKIKAVAAGFGGPVDRRSGKICRSHQIDGWDDFDLRAWLTDLTGAPSRVDNDANVAALAEATMGAGHDSDPVFYLTLGSGVGGGLVRGGKIYHGVPPGEAEFGHLLLDRSGVNVESRCSGWAVDGRIRKAIEADPAGIFAKVAGETRGCEAAHLAEALLRQDAAARQILDETTDDLAFALSHVVHLMHPQTIVLGGGLSLVGEPLRAGVARALSGYIMQAFLPGPSVRLAALGENAVPCGALLLAGKD